MDRQFVATHHRLGLVFEAKGMYDEAIDAFETAHRLSNGGAMAAAALAYVDAIAGRRAEAEQALQALIESSRERYVAAPYIAEIYLGLGDADRAMEWLERGLHERSSALARLCVNPRYDSLRADARFKRLVDRVGLHTRGAGVTGA
jgi:tetratricopeptide (TPR) repeat protein